MRYTLKDYQEHAVGQVVSSLKRARHDWGELKAPVAFSLTATTGAGKTVIAAAVIEALFDGSPDHSFDPDPGAVGPVVHRRPVAQRADALPPAGRRGPDWRLAPDRDREHLRPGEAGGGQGLLSERPEAGPELAPGQRLVGGSDARAFTMWDTLASTITDERLTLYLILDEAHRGMKTRNAGDRKERATIVQRLINGAEGAPPIPIVWGISATVERFTQAMANTSRTTYPAVDRPAGARAGLRSAEGRHPTGLPRPRRASSTPSCWRAPQGRREARRTAGATMRNRRAPLPRRWCPCWSYRSRTRRPTKCFSRPSPPCGRLGPTSNRMRWRTCSASTLRSRSEGPRSPTSPRRRCRTAPTSACCSPRTRSPRAGTVPGPKCSCPTGPPGTIPTSHSSLAGWLGPRSPGACPATTS